MPLLGVSICDYGENMLNIKLFALAVSLIMTPCVISAGQGEDVRIISGGGHSGSGQIRIINLGGALVGRKGGKARSSAAKSGKYAVSATKVAPASTNVSPMAVSAEFILREVYVFPNPAKRGIVPTFHIEVGIADRVKITVYNVAGEEAHKNTIAGMPIVIDDGNGPEYAYEYAWRGHIPSGVYYYLMEAEKSGKKLRKTGKFAVVR